MTCCEFPDVLESAVVAFENEHGLTKPKAFVVLEDGCLASDGLLTELQSFVKERIALFKYPREIEFVAGLPKTATGKIQRFKLRGQQALKTHAEPELGGG